MMITLTANPSMDRTVVLETPLVRGGVHRLVKHHRQQARGQRTLTRPVGQHRFDVVEHLGRFGQVQPHALAQQVAAGVGEEADQLQQLDLAPGWVRRRQRRGEERCGIRGAESISIIGVVLAADGTHLDGTRRAHRRSRLRSG